MSPTSIGPIEGERRRVLVTGGQRVGRDAVVEFADLDRPGRTCRAVVFRGQARGGLAVGDQCVIRYRAARQVRGLWQSGGWIFVERTDDAHVDQDAEVEAMTAEARA